MSNKNKRHPLLAAALAVGVLLVPSLVAAEEPADKPRILVFSKTEGWRHDSIIDGKRAMLELGQREGFTVDISENAGLFHGATLAEYDTVVFLNTTGSIFNDRQRRAFEQYIRAGGGFVGIHSAADTEHGWPWYNRLVGAYFVSHPQQQEAEKVVVDFDHPSTGFLKTQLDGNRWRRFDEWYNFKSLNPDVHVLINLDESTYEGGENGEDHPIAWYHAYDGGRAFYTGGGHTAESYRDPLFMRHILGGIRYVIGEPVNAPETGK
ncbi:ThuA domain-containing protein [Microbulbifer halophilus]|uniref:ThuA domain-containing protein n=1 Tax=Microbulbifer halophilus TaxID=453963 RepID=A0ABW5E6G5_9GAMM|nr:ThuA domain-containing protein [Microbulbifer halophilus]MCW8125552.1 ThuA domain-containing protein [Microbulbifer halophilus]